MSVPIKKLTIEGYKSIRKLEDFELRALNVLIGANGAGKSNLIGFFRLLHELIEQRLQKALIMEGGADACLHFGPQVTSRIAARLEFGVNGYEFALTPTVKNELVLDEQIMYLGKPRSLWNQRSGSLESVVKDSIDARGMGSRHGVPYHIYGAISNWIVYQFHDTSATAGVRRLGQINDTEYLRHDASNLAAFLYRMRLNNKGNYEQIRDMVRLAVPFFDDFKLRPDGNQPHMIQLEWLQNESDYPFLPSHLSDGTLRFICLATALLQPSPPATMIIDEPELGLHPQALTLLGNLFQQQFGGQDSERWTRQAVVSTQSALLLNEFAPEDVVVVERAQGQSFFRRLERNHLSEWLDEYTMGDLWQKNILGGRPRSERTPEEALYP